MKTCNSCKQSKPLDQFTKNKNTRDGLMRQCRKCNTERASKWHMENSDRANNRKRSRKFSRHNITEEIFLTDSANGCMICGATEELNIDHDHSCCPGTYSCGSCYRGVLCSKCNRALGGFKDDVDRLRSAVIYLQNNKHE